MELAAAGLKNELFNLALLTLGLRVGLISSLLHKEDLSLSENLSFTFLQITCSAEATAILLALVWVICGVSLDPFLI